MKFSFPGISDDIGEEVRRYFNSIIEQLTRFSQANIEVRGNLKSTYTTLTISQADTETAVPHNLGVMPFMYVANTDKGGVIYDSNRANWDSNTIYIKSSAAGASVRLLLFA